MAIRDRDIQVVILQNQLVMLDALKRLMHTPGVFWGSYKPDSEPDMLKKLNTQEKATRNALDAAYDWD